MIAKDKNTLILRNVIMPLWMLVWFPSWLWLILIPVNYGIDFLVLFLSLKGTEERAAICGKHAWKVCIAGFVADFLGALLMLFVWFTRIDDEMASALMMDPYTNVPATILTIVSVFTAGVLIYVFDSAILMRTGVFDTAQIKKSALMMAVVTAPWLYLIPSRVFPGWY